MRQTPLHDEYINNGGKVVDFHGWALPIHFKGIIDEHNHTRNKVSIFDCSHMCEFMVKGAKAIRALEKMVFNDMLCLKVGRCRYSSILDVCGGIIDDMIAMKLSEGELLVVTNAGPQEKMARIMHRVCGAKDITETTAKIDVQGPLARDVLLGLDIADIEHLKYFQMCRTQWHDTDIIVSRAGYTGELGYELFIPNELAVPLWKALLQHSDVEPAGLGARDTLRLEMGYTLYGQDVDEAHTTLEAAMDRFIDWDSEFNARDFLMKQREMGRYKKRTGIRSFSRQAPRPGQTVFRDSQPVGNVTSGTYGPTVGYGIGMAYIPVELTTPGTTFTVGPRELEVETVEFPFYDGGSLRS